MGSGWTKTGSRFWLISSVEVACRERNHVLVLQARAVPELVCLAAKGVTGLLGQIELTIAFEAACLSADLSVLWIEGQIKIKSLVAKTMWTTKEPGRGVRVGLRRGFEIHHDNGKIETWWARYYEELAELHYNVYRASGVGGWTYPYEESYWKAYNRCVRDGFDNDWPKGPFRACYEGAFSYRYVRYEDWERGRGYTNQKSSGWPGWYVEGNRKLRPGVPDRSNKWSVRP